MNFWQGIYLTDEEWTCRDYHSGFGKATDFETKLIATLGGSWTGAHRPCVSRTPGRTRRGAMGLTVGDGMLGLPTLVHRRLGNLVSVATLRYKLFLKLRLKHRDARLGRLKH